MTGVLDEYSQIDALEKLNLAALPRCPLPIRRGQHPKSHGCVDAIFRVGDSVPLSLRRGVFARAHAFRALVRLSNGRVFDDRRPDAHGMAIKLLDVPGAKLLEGQEQETTQDFVLVDSETFFTGVPDAYARVNRATMATGWERVLAWIGLLVRPALLLRVRAFVSKRPHSPLEIAYFSTVPFRLGDAAVKYAVLPRATATAPTPASADGLTRAVKATLASREVVFDFCVDVQNDPKVQPIDDPTRSWSASGAPRVVLAELVLLAQDVDSTAPLAENLQFSPWHALEDHAPLGFINRARAPIYRALASARHARNGISPLDTSEAPASFAEVPAHQTAAGAA